MALHKEKSYLDTAYNFRVNSDEMAQFKALCDEIPCPVSRGLNEYLAFAIKSKVLISSKDLGIVNYDGSITMANNLPVPSMPTVPSVPSDPTVPSMLSDPTAPKLNKTFDHIDHNYRLIERVSLTINGKPCPYWVGIKSDKSGSESAFFTPEIEIIEIQDGLDNPENIGNKSISLVGPENIKDSDNSLVNPDDTGNNDNSLDNPDDTSEGSNNQDGEISQIETPSNLNNTGLPDEFLERFKETIARLEAMEPIKYSQWAKDKGYLEMLRELGHKTTQSNIRDRSKNEKQQDMGLIPDHQLQDTNKSWVFRFDITRLIPKKK